MDGGEGLHFMNKINEFNQRSNENDSAIRFSSWAVDGGARRAYASLVRGGMMYRCGMEILGTTPSDEEKKEMADYMREKGYLT